MSSPVGSTPTPSAFFMPVSALIIKKILEKLFPYLLYIMQIPKYPEGSFDRNIDLLFCTLVFVALFPYFFSASLWLASDVHHVTRMGEIFLCNDLYHPGLGLS